jgi:hypothetical protein
MKGGGLALQKLIQPTISLEMPVPSQGHYGFHSFPDFSKKFGILMDRASYLDVNLINKGNNKITELRTKCL